MYYLNAFNEMLRKRQRQNMMGGEGYQGGGSTAPSGPMGLGPAQDRSSFRDFYNNMSPGASFALGMVPGVGTAFNLGKLANYAMSQYDKSQLAPSLNDRERAQDQFRAFEIADMNAPMQNTPQQSFRGSEMADSRSLNTPQQSFRAGEIADYGPPGLEYGSAPTSSLNPNPYEGGFYGSGAFNENAERMGGTGMLAVGAPISMGLPVGTALAPMAGDFGGSPAGFGGGFGGGVGTGEFGGSPESASDLGYAHGGMVTPDRLMGRAPAPDDGYGALQGGEYVITKAAVEKYGKRLLDAINNGTFR